ncbi:MAG: hypothetical protein WDO73_04505 [Ignavibacteriota bacterium]
MDSDLNNALDVGMETSVRLKPSWVVRVAEGVAIPAAPAGHVFYPLAKLSRPTNVATVDPAMITDLRQRRLTMSDMESRLRLAERLVVLPSFAPSPNQFAPKVGGPGQPVNLNGRNFNVGSVQNVVVTMGGVVAPIPVGNTPTATLIVATVPRACRRDPSKSQLRPMADR